MLIEQFARGLVDGSLYAGTATAGARTGLMSSFFVLSYLAFSLPAIAAGLFAGYFGLQSTAVGYGFALVAMAGAALLAMARRTGA